MNWLTNNDLDLARTTKYLEVTRLRTVSRYFGHIFSCWWQGSRARDAVTGFGFVVCCFLDVYESGPTLADLFPHAPFLNFVSRLLHLGSPFYGIFPFFHVTLAQSIQTADIFFGAELRLSSPLAIMRSILYAVGFLAVQPVLGRTDLQGCTSSEVVTNGGASYIFYVPDTGEICSFLDCGGGRAPPKSTVPGCPLYSGTAPVTPRYLPGIL